MAGRKHGAAPATRMARGRAALSRQPALRWLWLLVPIGTLGMAAFIPPVYFAVRERRRSGFFWSALLLAAITAFFIVDPGKHDHSHSTRHGVAVALIMLCLVGGAAVTVGFLASTPTDRDPVAIARQERKLREKARKLAADDPRLAIEAHVGRPDLRGDHRDGGLVDVNRVPASTLAQLPGIDTALADRIVASRGDVGGYSSLADLITELDLDPVRLDEAADHLVFIPLELDHS